MFVDLSPEVEALLSQLAARHGQTPAELARRAILEHMEDLEDEELAAQALAEDDGTRLTLEEVRAQLASQERSPA